MNSLARTVAFWVVLLLTAVLMYNVFSRPSIGRVTEITFGRFLDELSKKNVRSADIVDSELSGQFLSGEKFKTVVPTDYPALYDKLQGVNVTIEHATRNPWLAALTSWAPFILIIGFWIFFMRRMQKSGTYKNPFTVDPGSGNANVVQLEPDVAKAFPNSQSVNEALRLVIQLKHIPGTA
jgi:cell division protease FtsH